MQQLCIHRQEGQDRQPHCQRQEAVQRARFLTPPAGRRRSCSTPAAVPPADGSCAPSPPCVRPERPNHERTKRRSSRPASPCRCMPAAGDDAETGNGSSGRLILGCADSGSTVFCHACRLQLQDTAVPGRSTRGCTAGSPSPTARLQRTLPASALSNFTPRMVGYGSSGGKGSALLQTVCQPIIDCQTSGQREGNREDARESQRVCVEDLILRMSGRSTQSGSCCRAEFPRAVRTPHLRTHVRKCQGHLLLQVKGPSSSCYKDIQHTWRIVEALRQHVVVDMPRFLQ
eukprot:355237-Chlamydomonas_euryale.AAC.14